MVHLANAGQKVKGPIFFNLDKPVGKGPGVDGPAMLSEEVQLVQILLKALGFYSLPGSPGVSGTNDERTIEAITQFQLNHTAVFPDGRISVAHGQTFGPGTPFAIVKLNALVRDKHSDVWPRIHRIPSVSVPPLLFNRVTEILGVDQIR
jgi:hypothetical protein